MTQITVQDGKIVLRDGKVGTTQECCCDGGCPCDAQALHNSTKTVKATVVVTLPDVAGDCPAGEYTVEVELSSYNVIINNSLSGCGNFVLGQVCYIPEGAEQEVCYDIHASVLVYLVCQDGQYVSYAFFYAYSDCDSSTGTSCLIGNGGFVGFGADPEEYAVHGSSVQDGVCVPLAASSSADDPASVPGCSLSWTVWAE